MTVAVNLVGVPALSVPAPVTKLPVGFQIIGQYGKDAELLGLAAQFEKGRLYE
jgi:Asp-tRNA(Asn)/Glu-tRNA(Gln) amidotransferase A subunit family amidase